MIKEFIGTGKTLDEATAAAKAGLNAPSTADVKIEVVAMPQKKLFGLFGGSDAKVKVSFDDGKKEKKPQPKKEAKKEPVKKAPAKKQAPKAAPAKKAERAENPRPVVTEGEIDLDYACSYLKTMIAGLQIEDAEITAKLVDGVVEMVVKCEDYGIIIGRRGDTLDALQYLTSLAIKKQTDKYVRVTVNVGNYREKRVETLKNLAKKNAAYVLKTGRRFTFEPMNPYERRIIHTAVQEVEGVESRSIGMDKDRRVVIEPVGGVKYNSRPRNNNNSYKKNSHSDSPAKTAESKPAQKAEKPSFTKFGKIEVNKD